MAAPEDEDVRALVAVDDVGEALRAVAGEDVADVLFGEVGEAVVNLDIAVDIVAAGLYAYFAGGGIGGVAGYVVGADEDDVLIGEAVASEQLVEGEDVGLVAVVGPARGGGHEQGAG